MKKRFLNLSTIKRFSVASDILIPVALYYAMINQQSIAARILMGVVAMIRLALVIIAK